MKKERLKLEDVKVSSFVTSSDLEKTKAGGPPPTRKETCVVDCTFDCTLINCTW